MENAIIGIRFQFNRDQEAFPTREMPYLDHWQLIPLLAPAYLGIAYIRSNKSLLNRVVIHSGVQHSAEPGGARLILRARIVLSFVSIFAIVLLERRRDRRVLALGSRSRTVSPGRATL